MYTTVHTIKLQDGTLLNLKRRTKKHRTTLLAALTQVNDGRSDQGKRHELAAILLMLFCAMTAGNSSIDDCQLWALANERWLRQVVPLPHGIPHATTIARVLRRVDMDSFIAAAMVWQRVISQTIPSAVSLDGKTVRGAYGHGVIRHMLSLFSHGTHQTLGQIGVDQKENEIPAALRLFDQVDADLIAAVPFIGDAIHTQKDTVTAIIRHRAHYLLFVKRNQSQLYDNLALAFTDTKLPTDTATLRDDSRGRHMQTTVTVSHDPDLLAYLGCDWHGLTAFGMIHRTGTRTSRGNTTVVDETVYLISSIPKLTAAQARDHSRGHWQIENNLHWQKDWTFLEDRQTARVGNTPQALSLLRSLVIAFVRWFGAASVTKTTKNAQVNTWVHHRLLAMAAVM